MARRAPRPPPDAVAPRIAASATTYRAGTTAANAAGGAEVGVRRSTAPLAGIQRDHRAVLRVEPAPAGDDRAHAMAGQQRPPYRQRRGVERRHAAAVGTYSVAPSGETASRGAAPIAPRGIRAVRRTPGASPAPISTTRPSAGLAA